MAYEKKSEFWPELIFSEIKSPFMAEGSHFIVGAKIVSCARTINVDRTFNDSFQPRISISAQAAYLPLSFAAMLEWEEAEALYAALAEILQKEEKK